MRERKRFGNALGGFVAGVLLTLVLTASITPVGAHLVRKNGTGVRLTHLFRHLDARYEATDERRDIGLVKMSVDDPHVVLWREGPFTIKGSCLQEEGPGSPIRAEALIETTENDSSMESGKHEEEDFDVSDNGNPVVIADTGDAAPGGAPSNLNEDEIAGYAAAPSGTSISWMLGAFTNFAGAHCTFTGALFTNG